MCFAVPGSSTTGNPTAAGAGTFIKLQCEVAAGIINRGVYIYNIFYINIYYVREAGESLQLVYKQLLLVD